MNTTQPREQFVLVHTLWQGNVQVHRPRLSRLRVTDPEPIYTYRQHGRTRVSREPMLRVEFWWNEGRETGVASVSDLVAVGIACSAATMTGALSPLLSGEITDQ